MRTHLTLLGKPFPRMAPSRLWGKAGMGAGGGRVANAPRFAAGLASSGQAMRHPVNGAGSPLPNLPPAGEGVKPGAHNSAQRAMP
jgi:hypothetical protein